MKGLSVLVVDDSIVRGNTTRMLVKVGVGSGAHAQAIRQAGAKHVFVASAAPPVRFCNVYGIDMPTTQELIAHDMTPREVATAIDAEYLLYQTLDDLKRACMDAETCRGRGGGVRRRRTGSDGVRVLVLRRRVRGWRWACVSVDHGRSGPGVLRQAGGGSE